MTRSASPVHRRRRLMVTLAGGVILLGVLFVAVFPTTTYLRQRRDTQRAEAQLRAVEAERAAVKRKADKLTTPAEIEKRARESFGYTQQGEETYKILPAPADAIGLPDTWPFTGVERALGSG